MDPCKNQRKQRTFRGSILHEVIHFKKLPRIPINSFLCMTVLNAVEEYMKMMCVDDH